MTTTQTQFSARISKEDFETWVKQGITDEQWELVSSEIDGRLENFTEGLISELVNDCQEQIGIFDNGD
jgi:hypothetical protein